MKQHNQSNPNYTPGSNPLANRRVFSTEKKKRMMEDANKPVEIVNLGQLQEMLAELMDVPIGKEVKVSAEMKWINQKTHKMESRIVNGVSRDTSLFGLLLDGMNVIKKRQESVIKVNEAIKKAKELDSELSPNMIMWDIDNIKFNVDSLIERKLGGRRRGLRVQWKLPEGIFEFDPFARRFFKIDDSPNKVGDTDKTKQPASAG